MLGSWNRACQGGSDRPGPHRSGTVSDVDTRTPALAILLGLLAPQGAEAALPLARRLADTTLARDLVSDRRAPDLAALKAGGEEVALDLFLEPGASQPSPGRWGRDRYELVRARGAEGDESLLAFDHRARRWWRLDATRREHGPLDARLGPDGRVLLTRGFLGERPTVSSFVLSDAGFERQARFQIPWGEMDRDLLRRIREGGLAVTSPDTQVVVFTGLDPLEIGPDGPRVQLRGTAYLGRLEAFRQAHIQADPTMDLTARDVMLTRDWIPPGTMPVVLRIEQGRAWVAGVGHLDERVWAEPEPVPGRWHLRRPR